MYRRSLNLSKMTQTASHTQPLPDSQVVFVIITTYFSLLQGHCHQRFSPLADLQTCPPKPLHFSAQTCFKAQPRDHLPQYTFDVTSFPQVSYVCYHAEVICLRVQTVAPRRKESCCVIFSILVSVCICLKFLTTKTFQTHTYVHCRKIFLSQKCS